MKEQEIGELYKEKLSGYATKPSPAVWDGIANAAPVKRFARGRQFRYWGLRAGVPALFTAAVITAAVILLRPAPTAEKVSEPQSRTTTQVSSITPEISKQTTEQQTINTTTTPSTPVRTATTQPSANPVNTPAETAPVNDIIPAETSTLPSPTPTASTTPQPKTLPANGGNGKPENPTVPNKPEPEATQVVDHHPTTNQKEDFRLTYSHDTLVCRNSKLTLFVLNADQVYWSFGSDLSSVDLIVEENTRVEAMVHTKDGKDTTIRVNITVCDCELFIPTAFTPNGDGLNDEWLVYAPANVTDFECMVYDKAGTLLFHTRNIHQGWNGMNNGKYLPAGGYFYSCRYRDELGNPHVQKGQVTLVR